VSACGEGAAVGMELKKARGLSPDFYWALLLSDRWNTRFIHQEHTVSLVGSFHSLTELVQIHCALTLRNVFTCDYFNIITPTLSVLTCSFTCNSLTLFSYGE
jgi:hypothetical protein